MCRINFAIGLHCASVRETQPHRACRCVCVCVYFRFPPIGLPAGACVFAFFGRSRTREEMNN